MEKNKDEVKRITTKQHGLGRKRGNEKKKEKKKGGSITGLLSLGVNHAHCERDDCGSLKKGSFYFRNCAEI